MELPGRRLRRSVGELNPGTKDKLLFWGASVLAVVASTVALLLV
jgi:hypothetical protein